MVYSVQNDHQDEEENDKTVSIRHTHECVHTQTLSPSLFQSTGWFIDFDEGN